MEILDPGDCKRQRLTSRRPHTQHKSGVPSPVETREAGRSPKEAGNLNEIRRKLRSQRGVTVVFALVIFLIMALFSYVMVNASLTAVQGANASRVDEQAALSVASASRVLQQKIQTELPNQIQYVTGSQWVAVTNPLPANSWLQYILKALNEMLPDGELILTVSGDNTDVTNKIGEVKVHIKAENNKNVTDTSPSPRLILDFRKVDKDGTVLYRSNTVITLQMEKKDTDTSVYTIKPINPETQIVSTLGQYQAS